MPTWAGLHLKKSSEFYTTLSVLVRRYSLPNQADFPCPLRE